MIAISIFLIASFLAGSVPFGFLLVKVRKKEDARKHGSGNIDGANVARTFGKGLGILTMFLDGFKGFLPVLVAMFLGNRLTGVLINDLTILASFAALAVVMGHVFTPWLGFKGGKGVAVALGAALAFSAGEALELAPMPFLLSLGIFVITTAITRYVSLGSISGILALPSYYLYKLIAFNRFDTPYILAVWTIIALLVIARHRENIARIINGSENRLF